jgi:hypothetical protein
MRSIYRFIGGVAFTLAIAPLALTDETSGKSTEQLAKEAQNPAADLISIPFQNNFNFGYGPYGNLQYILNIQPVVSSHLTEDCNLITRTIVPVFSQPQLSPSDKAEWGSVM